MRSNIPLTKSEELTKLFEDDIFAALLLRNEQFTQLVAKYGTKEHKQDLALLMSFIKANNETIEPLIPHLIKFVENKYMKGAREEMEKFLDDNTKLVDLLHPGIKEFQEISASFSVFARSSDHLARGAEVKFYRDLDDPIASQKLERVYEFMQEDKSHEFFVRLLEHKNGDGVIDFTSIDADLRKSGDTLAVPAINFFKKGLNKVFNTPELVTQLYKHLEDFAKDKNNDEGFRGFLCDNPNVLDFFNSQVSSLQKVRDSVINNTRPPEVIVLGAISSLYEKPQQKVVPTRG